MRNRFLAAVGVALVLGVLAFDAQARPGGGRRGGPARVGGGAGPGNFRAGGNARSGGQFGQNVQNFRMPNGKAQSLAGSSAIGNLNSGSAQNKVSQLKTNFTAANQPFTPAWYANHPGAWQYTHPHADAWAVATAGTAAAWLGLAAVTGGTVYTAETADETADDADDSASDDNSVAGDYLPLGVFALAPKSEKDASALVQLAVNKQGVVRGNYYDVLTGQTQPVAGTLDKQTQRATFKAVPSGNVTFETSLASLTQPAGTVTLKFDGGQAKQWTLARFDDAQAN
jgi:hypothetical protein